MALPDSEVDLAFVMSLAEMACEMIVEGSKKKEKLMKEKKTFADLVTETDEKIEKRLIEEIKQKFKNHNFFCEESAGSDDKLTDEPTWVIDPIDGTTNFIHGLPMCCVSIGFMRNKEVIFGCVYAPFLNQRFYAERGGGAYLNGQKISSSNCTTLSSCLLVTDLNVSRLDEKVFASDDTDAAAATQRYIIERNFANIRQIAPRVRGIRYLGSCAITLSYVACGFLDAYFEFGPHEWDISAGMLIAREAGAQVLDMNGENLDDIGKGKLLAAATLDLGKALSQLIRE